MEMLYTPNLSPHTPVFVHWNQLKFELLYLGLVA